MRSVAYFIALGLPILADTSPCHRPDEIVSRIAGDCCIPEPDFHEVRRFNYFKPDCHPEFSQGDGVCSGFPSSTPTIITSPSSMITGSKNPSSQSSSNLSSPTATASHSTSTGDATIYTKCKIPGQLSITWDDGPALPTSLILNNFTMAGVPISHFINGKNRADLSDPRNYGVKLVKAMHNAGHTIGTHMWQHLRISRLSKDELARQLCLNDKYIEKVIGKTPRFFRAPFLDLPSESAQWIASWGYTIVHFNLNPQDWKHRKTSKTLEVFKNTLERANPKSDSFISNTHEHLMSSVDAVPTLLKSQYIKRWKLVTVGECMGYSKPSEWYRSNPWGKNGLPTC